MNTERLLTEIALCVLSQWYTSWEGFKDAKYGMIRRKALSAKCWGLVCHDRVLNKRKALP